MSNSVAVFKGLSKSGNSAKVMLKRNEFELGGTFGYLASAPFKGMKKNDTLEVPAGWSIEERADENGEVYTYPDSDEPIAFFTWKNSK
jgi:hypothetical protein